MIALLFNIAIHPKWWEVFIFHGVLIIDICRIAQPKCSDLGGFPPVKINIGLTNRCYGISALFIAGVSPNSDRFSVIAGMAMAC